MLKQVPYKTSAIDSSPKDILSEFWPNIIKIGRAIHNYSFDLFAHRVNKREHKLSDIRMYIEQDQMHFRPEDRRTLLQFLWNVNLIIKIVTNAKATKQLSTDDITIFLKIYSDWMKLNLLPKDALADNEVTLLDNADTWLAKGASPDA